MPNTAQITQTKQNSSEDVTVDCTKYGKLTVQKLVEWNGTPAVPTQEFPIRVQGPNGFDQSFTLTDTQVVTFTDLVAGVYTTTESATAGYELVSIVSPQTTVTPGKTGSVVVNNRKLLGTVSVTKTANPSFTREYKWDLDKAVDPSSFDLFEGDLPVNANYTVSATVALTVDTAFRLTGTVTIANPGPNPAVLTHITDTLSSGEELDLSCLLGATPVPVPLTANLVLPAGQSILCTYDKTFGDIKPDVTSNTAAVKLTTGDPITDNKDFDFETPTKEINKQINVTDKLDIRDRRSDVDLHNRDERQGGELLRTLQLYLG